MHRLIASTSLIMTLALLIPGCSASSGAGMDPGTIEAKYGVSGAYVDKISTEDGTMDATIVPTTLEDGRSVQLVIPHKQLDPDHQVYMREGAAMTPVALADPSVKRQEFVKSEPRVVERRAPADSPGAASTSPTKKRTTKDEVLIIGGSAGAGAAVGAVAGGKKGAAVGALSGGIAGLVYDLATKNKNK